jgi:hypothetical protein
VQEKCFIEQLMKTMQAVDADDDHCRWVVNEGDPRGLLLQQLPALPPGSQLRLYSRTGHTAVV